MSLKMDLHRLIHCNLQHLDLYHPISFTINEGMFKVTNIKGFQETMHYLLNIVDDERCKDLIQFPLLDKKAESQFRIGVRTFLTEINDKYSEANLPKIAASFLMNPGGDKFANFMWKLTSFVLYKTISHGSEKMLLPPRILKNDKFAANKLTLLKELIECETRKALAYQSKLDSLASQKCEWECNLELNELDEKIRQHEMRVKELIEEAPVSSLMKEKLGDLKNNSAALTEWTNEVELEGRRIEAMVHLVSKYSSSLAELNKTLSLAESYKTTHHCIDVNSITECENVLDESTQELFLNARKGNMSLTDFIQRLNENQDSLLRELHSSPVDLSKLASDLNAVSKEFEDCEQAYVTVENKIQEQLTQVSTKLDEILSELSSEETELKEQSPRVPDEGGDLNSPTMSFTPIRGVFADIKEKMENAHSCRTVIDMGLTMTPELERKFDTPVSSSKREVTSPLSCGTKSSTKKIDISDLHSLTSSLLKKKRLTQLSEKKCREPVKLPANLSEETEVCWEYLSNDIFMERNEEETDAFSSLIDDKDVRTSPSLLLSSTSADDDQTATNKTCDRRKSLDAIIQRYLKVRKNMSC